MARVNGYTVTFKPLPIRERFLLALELGSVFGDAPIGIEVLGDPEKEAFVDRMIAMSDAPEELFDADLSAQIVVAFEAVKHYTEGLFPETKRMSLTESKHPAIKKALSGKDEPDARAMAPEVSNLWFLYRPVSQSMCTYREMFIDEIFSFKDIHAMHEILDLQQFNELVAHHQP